jgi:hypothetical protein
MISLKIPKLFHALAKSSKAPFVRDDIELLTSQEWAVIKKDVRSENGRRANQGTVRSFANQMELKTGVMPSLEAAASKMASNHGGKSVGKPKGNAEWAKVVQISGFDEEILGTEKCGDTKAKICAELCHQGIGLSFSHCKDKYIGMWFKYAGESADNSTIIFHRNADNKRWKLTILTAKLGGPVEKMSFFQIVHMTKVSTSIHSSISQYDVYKVSSKKIYHNLTVGCLND